MSYTEEKQKRVTGENGKILRNGFGNKSPEQLEYFLSNSAKITPGIVFETLAYPIKCWTITSASARGGGGGQYLLCSDLFFAFMTDLQHALNENLYFLSGIINHISYVPLHNKPYAIVMRANQSSLSVDVSFFFRHKKNGRRQQTWFSARGHLWTCRVGGCSSRWGHDRIYQLSSHGF